MRQRGEVRVFEVLAIPHVLGFDPGIAVDVLRVIWPADGQTGGGPDRDLALYDYQLWHVWRNGRIVIWNCGKSRYRTRTGLAPGETGKSDAGFCLFFGQGGPQPYF